MFPSMSAECNTRADSKHHGKRIRDDQNSSKFFHVIRDLQPRRSLLLPLRNAGPITFT
jgi:hypothetical protein